MKNINIKNMSNMINITAERVLFLQNQPRVSVLISLTLFSHYIPMKNDL